jgi:Flp pilus assembly protein TadB
MTMDELDRYQNPRERLPALIDYLKGDQVRRAVETGQPIINITINEAPRPAPVPTKEDIATKYAGHMILATWSMIVLAGVAVVFVMIAGAMMTMMISTAVCAVAVAAAVRSLRMSKEEARAITRTRRD